MLWLLAQMSLPYWLRHKGRALLLVVAISAGVAAIVATAAVANSVLASFHRVITQSAGGADIQVANAAVGVPLHLAEVLSSFEGVERATPIVQGTIVLADEELSTLSLIGIDLVGDARVHDLLPAGAVHVADEAEFIAIPDSIAVSRAFADKRGLAIGSSVAVITPTGKRRLVVRGLIDDVGVFELLGGRAAVMDLPAAQLVTARGDRVDRIDIAVAEGADAETVAAAVREHVEPLARVYSGGMLGERASQVLRSLRVMLALSGALAVVVAFFTIYHSVETSLSQRRADIALLAALGVSGQRIVGWIALEALLIAALAAGVGALAGVGLAALAISTFSVVTTAWITATTASLDVGYATIGGAMGAGTAAAVMAAGFACWMHLRGPIAGAIRATATTGRKRPAFVAAIGIGGVVLVVVAVMLAAAPAALPFAPLVGFILAVNCLLLISAGIMSPLVVYFVSLVLARVAERVSGVGTFLSAHLVARQPVASVAVVSGIVMAMGWTIANSSLVSSFQGSWFKWADDYYSSDLVMSGGGRTMDILTARTFSDDVVRDVAALDGVTQVQGQRRVEIDFRGEPAVLLAFDAGTWGFPTTDRHWDDISGAFWSGDGVLVSEGLARSGAATVGGTLELMTPTGEFSAPVLAAFRDVYGGGLPAIAVARPTYVSRWNDRMVDRVAVWTDEAARADLLAQLNDRFAEPYGVITGTFADARAGVRLLIDGAFSLTYAMVFVSLAVSAVGVVSFLLSAVVARDAEYRTLHALGLDSRQIARSVALEGGLLGFCGSLVGTIAGIGVSAVIVLQSIPMVNGWHFDLQLSWSSIALTVVAVTLASLACSVIPGAIAARGGTTWDGRQNL
jgi:putative ABC transport system permease protein